MARAIEGALFTLVLLSGLLAVSGRISFAVGIVLAVVTLAGQWADIIWPNGPIGPFYLIPAILFLGLVVARLLFFILQSDQVNTETLCASVAGFLMIGLLWALIYLFLARLSPGSFVLNEPGQVMDGFNAFYFSFVTLSTIGYGDITPVSRVARMLAVMEAITGMFYLTVLVARLVSIHSAAPKKPREE